MTKHTAEPKTFHAVIWCGVQYEYRDDGVFGKGKLNLDDVSRYRSRGISFTETTRFQAVPVEFVCPDERGTHAVQIKCPLCGKTTEYSADIVPYKERLSQAEFNRIAAPVAVCLVGGFFASVLFIEAKSTITTAILVALGVLSVTAVIAWWAYRTYRDAESIAASRSDIAQIRFVENMNDHKAMVKESKDLHWHGVSTPQAAGSILQK